MYDLCIIGFGISGISCAKQALSKNLNIIVLEKNESFGGCWLDKAFHFTHLQTSGLFYQFSDFIIPNFPLHPSKKQVLQYLLAYIVKYRLLKYVKFSSLVLDTRWDSKLWHIQFENGNIAKTIQARYICICTGLLNKPNNPNIPSLKSFSGDIYHSHQLKDDLSQFRNKNVIIVGNGATGLELACQISNYSKPITILYRTPKILAKKYLFGISTSIIISRFFLRYISGLPMIYYYILIYIGSRIFYRNLLPLPNRKCNCNLIVGNTRILDLIKKNKIVYLKETITNISQKEVILSSGKNIIVDSIILATGYQQDIPFLKIDLPLYNYKFIINPKIKNCGFIGMTPAYNWMQVIEIQSRWFIDVIIDKIVLPDITSMECIVDKLKNEKKKQNLSYNDLIYESFNYCDELMIEMGLHDNIIYDIGYWFQNPLY